MSQTQDTSDTGQGEAVLKQACKLLPYCLASTVLEGAMLTVGEKASVVFPLSATILTCGAGHAVVA